MSEDKNSFFLSPPKAITTDQFKEILRAGLLWFHEKGFEGQHVSKKIDGRLCYGYSFLEFTDKQRQDLFKEFHKFVLDYYESMKK